MSSAFRVKDQVALRGDDSLAGMIVKALGHGKFKVLWDKDWETGRVFIHHREELAPIT